MRTLTQIVSATLLSILTTTTQAATQFDISIPWGPTEFHTVNAQNFAERVAEATGDEVQMTVHPGGALGIKANESLRAIEDGTAAMAEFAAFQNVGEVPLLGIESLPFLVDDYAQLKVMHSFARPQWEKALAERGVKVLYVVPWPSQNFFLKNPISKMEDMKGVRMRTYNKLTADMVSSLGMTPQQMNNPDIVPALASGRLDAVMTSGSTAVSQKYWEFLNHTYNTNHLWASNLMVVGLDYWNQLSEEHQSAIETLAKEMEPEFWAISEAEHATRMQQLKDNGMTVQAAPEDLIKRMKEVTRPMWDEFPGEAGDVAEQVLMEYMQATGKQ